MAASNHSKDEIETFWQRSLQFRTGKEISQMENGYNNIHYYEDSIKHAAETIEAIQNGEEEARKRRALRFAFSHWPNACRATLAQNGGEKLTQCALQMYERYVETGDAGIIPTQGGVSLDA